MLAAAGYPNGFKTDIVAQDTVDLDLLQVVKSYFLAVGIDMEIRVLPSADWTAFVMRGRKQDQLAQRFMGGLGSTYALFRQLQRYQTGYTTNWLMVSDPVFDGFYTKAVAASNIDQIKQIVKDANKYVAEQHWSISLLQFNLFTANQPWLKGYGGQSFTIGGGNSGPMFAGYFLARFWVDQNIKKASGH
jgi:ABC-type transport system substrate-binding protein